MVSHTDSILSMAYRFNIISGIQIQCYSWHTYSMGTAHTVSIVARQRRALAPRYGTAPRSSLSPLSPPSPRRYFSPPLSAIRPGQGQGRGEREGEAREGKREGEANTNWFVSASSYLSLTLFFFPLQKTDPLKKTADTSRPPPPPLSLSLSLSPFIYISLCLGHRHRHRHTG